MTTRGNDYPGLYDVDLVLYHASCNDGFCAAWVYWRLVSAWRKVGYEIQMPEFVPVQYGKPAPDVTGKVVLIFDFSYPRDELVAMEAASASLLVFDHHKTAEAQLRGLEYCTFDMNKSGARLVHDWLHGSHVENWMVDYTEDRDLWRFDLPQSREITAGLGLYPRDFEVWEGLFSEVGRRGLVSRGATVMEYQEQEVARALSPGNVAWHSFRGHRVPTINQTSSTMMSQAVGSLAQIFPESAFAAGFFVLPDGQYVYSLRSRGNFDVSEVAKAMGGGGHPGAAGFKSSRLLLASA